MTKPAILTVVADADARERIRAELARRYVQDYELACTSDPQTALASVEGKQVAVVLAEQWLPGTTGVELLAEVRARHPHAKRALLVDWGAWGDPPTAEAIVTAMALGRIDYYVLKPWRVPDELFHRTLGEFLHEWARAGGAGGPRELTLVGQQWSPRTHELRTLLTRNGVPHAFHATGSEDGGEALERAGLAGETRPVVTLFDGRALVDPTNVEVAEGWGVRTTLDTERDFDVIVVGAGPAGAAAALVLARAGARVALLERGPFPGSKNMYGGVVYGRILDDLIPRWWDEVPVQRWVTRRATMVLTATQSLTVDFRTGAWGRAPYNGCTTLRPDFDAWLAGHAERAGATLLCSTTATGLRRDGTGRIVGVRTDRPGGDLDAPVVIAADGVNSFLAKEAGLHHHQGAEHYTLGAKEVLALPRHVIDERFGLRGDEGADIEIVGATGAIAGGGFLYTNAESVAVGVVLSLNDLARSGRRPEQCIAELKAHPAIASLVEGGDLQEYSAHLLPEGGYDAMPDLVADGLLVTGDAAGLCLAAGIWLEGVNFAMASGIYAAEATIEALAAGDPTRSGLAGYERRLGDTFVLRDHRKLRRAPALVLSDRVQHLYPRLVANTIEAMFRVDNPAPKLGLRRIVTAERKRLGIRRRDLLRDAVTGGRTFG